MNFVLENACFHISLIKWTFKICQMTKYPHSLLHTSYQATYYTIHNTIYRLTYNVCLTLYDHMCIPYMITYAYPIWSHMHTLYDHMCIPYMITCTYPIWSHMHTLYDHMCIPNKHISISRKNFYGLNIKSFLSNINKVV